MRSAFLTRARRNTAPSVGTNLKRPIPIPSNFLWAAQRFRHADRPGVKGGAVALDRERARWLAWHEGLAFRPLPDDATIARQRAVCDAPIEREDVC